MRAGQCQAGRGKGKAEGRSCTWQGRAPADAAGLGGRGPEGRMDKGEILERSQTPGKEKGVTAGGMRGHLTELGWGEVSGKGGEGGQKRRKGEHGDGAVSEGVWGA